MRHVRVENDFESWRAAARRLIAERVSPDEIVWSGETQAGLYETPATVGPAVQRAGTVPRSFMKLAAAAACFDDPEKWPLLYRILYRLSFENKDLLQIESDKDVRDARLMEKAVDRDVHKFHAFVRFRSTEVDGNEMFVAWHEPQHWSVERATPFFARRFGGMRWSIFTPKGCAHWDLQDLTFSPAAQRPQAPTGDEMEEFWRLYYRSIFNPFRLNVKTMKRELPVRHWATLPEADLIPELIASAVSGDTLGK